MEIIVDFMMLIFLIIGMPPPVSEGNLPYFTYEAVAMGRFLSFAYP